MHLLARYRYDHSNGGIEKYFNRHPVYSFNISISLAMKHTIIFFLCSFIYLISCNTAKNKEAIPFPVVIDTADFKKKDSLLNEAYSWLHTDKEDNTWLSTANHPIAYIGKLTDTIFLNYGLRFGFSPPPILPGMKVDKSYKSHQERYYVEREEGERYLYAEKSNVNIRIDTTKQINACYAVLLTNNEKDTLGIGYGKVLPLILEAKDSAGKWRPIEKKFRCFCGVGIGTIILPPKEVVLTMVTIPHGNFSTDIRLAYGDNHSVSFKGTINYRQFKSRYTETGNYTAEYEKELKEREAKSH